MTTSETTLSEQIGRLRTENGLLWDQLLRAQARVELLEKALYDKANPEGGKVQMPQYVHIL